MTLPQNEHPAAPDAIEEHPFRYAWQERLEVAETLWRGEGESIHSATGEGAYWIVHDSGTLADFLDDDDPIRSILIKLKRYDDRVRWNAAVASVRKKMARPTIMELDLREARRVEKSQGSLPSESDTENPDL